MDSEASLGAIVRAKGGELLEKFPTSSAQRKVMRAMADCRSAALGGHRDRCDSCGFEHIFWNSRRDRHCHGETVTFSWRDYADHNAEKTMELEAVEFLRRFLQHVLPPRFTRVRYYGFLANRDRAVNIAKARELIGSKRPLRPRPPIPDPRLCPQCHKGTMRRIAPVDPQCHRTWFDTS